MAEKYVKVRKVPAREEPELNIEAIKNAIPGIYLEECVPASALRIADGFFPEWWTRQKREPKRLDSFKKAYHFWEYRGDANAPMELDLFTDGEIKSLTAESCGLSESITYGLLVKSGVLPTNSVLLTLSGDYGFGRKILRGISDMSGYRHGRDVTADEGQHSNKLKAIEGLKEAYNSAIGEAQELAPYLGLSVEDLEKLLIKEEKKE